MHRLQAAVISNRVIDLNYSPPFQIGHEIPDVVQPKDDAQEGITEELFCETVLPRPAMIVRCHSSRVRLRALLIRLATLRSTSPGIKPQRVLQQSF